MNLSKFLPPRPAYILERERLLARLQEWENGKLVVIHAQAGQGKSTLWPDIDLARFRAEQAVGELTGGDLKFNDACSDSVSFMIVIMMESCPRGEGGCERRHG